MSTKNNMPHWGITAEVGREDYLIWAVNLVVLHCADHSRGVFYVTNVPGITSGCALRVYEGWYTRVPGVYDKQEA